MKHLVWLVSALTLAGIADDAETWVYDTTARSAAVRSVATGAAEALESRVASMETSRIGDLESRVTSLARSVEGGLDARPPAGFFFIVR